MRLPRMTTRQWMIVVAIVALSFGGWRYGARLKRERDRRLAMATWHAVADADHRRLIATAVARGAFQKRADQEEMEESETGAVLDSVIDREFGLPSSSSIQSEGHDRFLAARARVRELAPRRRKLLAEFSRKEAEYHRKQAEYHAELSRKYLVAASRPWLPLAPDPPSPGW